MSNESSLKIVFQSILKYSKEMKFHLFCLGIKSAASMQSEQVRFVERVSYFMAKRLLYSVDFIQRSDKYCNFSSKGLLELFDG